MMFYFDLYGRDDGIILFINKENDDVKIVERVFDRSLTNGSPYRQIRKVEKLTDYFIVTEEIDTTKIDLDKWIDIMDERESK